MTSIVNLAVILAKRKCRSKELSKATGLTETHISILKSGKARAIRFSSLQAICKHLGCQPGDLLEYHPGEDEKEDD